MQRPSHAGLRHVALNVRDLAAMKRFYVDLLGFAVEWEPDADNVYLSSGLDNLALHRAACAARDSALDHIGLIVRGAVFLEGRGVALATTPRTHRAGARSFYFCDPDGNAIQIIHHPPISGKA